MIRARLHDGSVRLSYDSPRHDGAIEVVSRPLTPEVARALGLHLIRLADSADPVPTDGRIFGDERGA